MKIITDSEKLSDKKFLKSLHHGVYIMQNSRHPYEFCVGAVGTKSNAALPRLLQYVRVALGWKLVFFTQFLTDSYVYSAEAVLFGGLCGEYNRRTNSRFSVDKDDCTFHHVAEKVQCKASKVMDDFRSSYYSPEGLGFRPVDSERELRAI